MKSAGRRELRHPSSSNMRYSENLYNVEGLDHKVHEPVIVPGMADMKHEGSVIPWNGFVPKVKMERS